MTDPFDETAAFAEAIAHQDSRRHGEAAQAYRRILARHPDSADALRLLGIVFLRSSDHPRAGALLQRALAAAGLHPEIVSTLGQVHHAMGNSRAAETIWRIAVASDPQHLVAQRSLGMLAIEDRAPAEGHRRFRRAAATGASATRQDEFIGTAELVSSILRTKPSGRTPTRYLLIRPWVCGFWGEVNHVAVQLAFAEITGRVPMVFWGPEVRYGAPGFENAWDAYFEPVSTVTPAELRRQGLTIFPDRWRDGDLLRRGFNHVVGQGPHEGISSLYLLNSEADIVVADGFNDMNLILRWRRPGGPLSGLGTAAVYRRIFDTYIRIQDRHWRTVDGLAGQLFPRRPIVAVHYRAPTPGKRIESLEQRDLTDIDYFRAVDGFLSDNPGGSIFLLTDFAPALGLFRDRYGDAVRQLPATRLRDIQDAGGDLGLDPSHDGYSLGMEVLLDAMLATRADAFVGDGASGVSCSIAHLRNWPEGRLTLLRRNVFAERR
jgi:tetratricopeptide (TPR) repeat protein